MSDVLEQPQLAINPFGEESWATQVPENVAPQPAAVPAPEPPQPNAATEPPAAVPSNEEVFDEFVYLKNNFGWDNKEAALNELKELREAKNKGFEFANEDSRKIFEYIKEGKQDDLYNYFDQQKKLDKLLKAETLDRNLAAEIIKMNYAAQNIGLTSEELDFMINEKYAVPSKPIQKVDETDEEYSYRVNEWTEAAKRKDMQMAIDAKMAKPNLSKLKSELVLPDIQKPQPQVSNEPSPEEVAKYEKARERYLQEIESTFTKFNGFNMVYKSEAGEIPISYVVNDEQKGAFKSAMSDFDLGKFIQEAWFPSEDNPNIPRLTEDVFFLRNKEAILQKVASEAYAKGLQNYLKQKSNINIQTPQQTFTPDTQQTDRDKQIAFIWANS